MQQRAAEVYELFFASLSLQVATAVEEIRLVHFVPAHRQAQERRQLLTHGLGGWEKQAPLRLETDVQDTCNKCS